MLNTPAIPLYSNAQRAAADLASAAHKAAEEAALAAAEKTKPDQGLTVNEERV